MGKYEYGLRKLTLGYQGLFDFGGFYRLMVNFYKSRHYDYEYEKYKDKEGSPIGHEVELVAKPDKKIGEYIKYKHVVEFWSWDFHEVEVVRNGKAEKLTWCRFKLDVRGHIIVDWQKFSKYHPKMQKFFDNHVIKREITEFHEPTLTFETQALIDELKQFLQMEVTRLEKPPLN